MTLTPSAPANRLAVRGDAVLPGSRQTPEETAVALVYGGTTQAVLMATPADLEDLAYGFSLTEGIAEPGDIASLDIVEQPDGVELRMWLAPGAATDFSARRRATLGPIGCGLCGIESLEQAVRPPLWVESDLRLTASQIHQAMESLRGLPLGTATRAVHAAGLWRPGEGLVVSREDVGRHNALDKVAGALARSGQIGRDGVVVVTSRVSVEMVQKTARIGAAVIAAISAPTMLAIRTAEAAGITLIAVARDDGFEVFSGLDRLGLGAHALEAARQCRPSFESIPL